MDKDRSFFRRLHERMIDSRTRQAQRFIEDYRRVHALRSDSETNR